MAFPRNVRGRVDTDAAGWAARVTAAGGTFSPRTLLAVTNFSRWCKAAGVWTKLNRVNLFCGDQLAAALVPLKIGSGGPVDTNTSFVSGDYTEATALTGNGTSKSLDTGVLGSALTANDTHLAVYNRSSTNNPSIHIGAESATRIGLSAPYSDGIVYSDQYDTGTGRLITAGAIAAPFGFVVATRTSAALHSSYRNGTQVASNVTSGGTLPAVSIAVFGINAGGVVGQWTNNTLAGYSIGAGLAAVDVAAYYAAMQAFQTALGRQV